MSVRACALCDCVWIALLDFVAHMSAARVSLTSKYVCECGSHIRTRVRARAHTPARARVGDDALRTRMKSRGGKEFLCVSRPVLPFGTAALLAPLRRLILPSVLPLVPGLQPWGRFESGSRWMRGKRAERETERERKRGEKERDRE